MQRLADAMKADTEKKEQGEMKKTRRGAGAKRAKRERKAKVGKRELAAVAERSVTSGLTKKPKNKILFLNTEAARAVTKKALAAILDDLSGEEKFEAERILARLAARE